ncbi:hypothetical protein SKAU_G00117300 [Synaphobranchus kaupii]|uniref:Uncharacterized protein n=1 Tax=Synaphobranchus kaupii TaxID=118154 RepID=A0A9Q1J136_SYNKA|nr:hypothetical protein SKAU_G00117300 [Synaphobranchus kaupii]
MGLGPYLLIAGLLLLLPVETTSMQCEVGWATKEDKCIDVDECTDPVCGLYAVCINTNGSFYCQCEPGFHTNSPSNIFTGFEGQCIDINECLKTPDICGPNALCRNTMGSQNCTCSEGYTSSNGQRFFHIDKGVTCEDEDECEIVPPVCGRNGTCTNSPGRYTCTCDPGFSNNGHGYAPCSDVDECTADPAFCGEKGSCLNTEGSYTCTCDPDYSNYGNAQGQCVELNCDQYKPTGTPDQVIPDLEYIVSLMRNSCFELKAGGSGQLNGEMLLEKLFTKTNDIMSDGPPESSHDVSSLLTAVENAMRLIGPQMRQPQTTIQTTHTVAELLVWRERTPPQGLVSIASEQARLDIDWETAAGNSSYPGFAVVSLVIYKGLESATNHSFPKSRDSGNGNGFQMDSKVVTACVSNPATGHLDRPVTFTFSHLQSRDVNHTCVFWDTQSGEGGSGRRGAA